MITVAGCVSPPTAVKAMSQVVPVVQHVVAEVAIEQVQRLPWHFISTFEERAPMCVDVCGACRW